MHVVKSKGSKLFYHPIIFIIYDKFLYTVLTPVLFSQKQLRHLKWCSAHKDPVCPKIPTFTSSYLLTSSILLWPISERHAVTINDFTKHGRRVTVCSLLSFSAPARNLTTSVLWKLLIEHEEDWKATLQHNSDPMFVPLGWMKAHSTSALHLNCSIVPAQRLKLRMSSHKSLCNKMLFSSCLFSPYGSAKSWRYYE